MLTKIKLALQLVGILKNHWQKILIILFIVGMMPLFLIISAFSLFSWVGWESEEPQNYKPYQELAAEHNLIWQELFVIDLVKHEMDLDELDPDSLEDDFVYYVKEEVQVCKTVTTTTGSGKDKKETTTESCSMEEVENKYTRPFQQVMYYLGFTEEQREMAQNSLNLLYEETGGPPIGSASGSVSENVLRYEDLVRKYAKQNNVENLVAVILAMIMQESGGNMLDVMQSSESLGLAPNAITDPEYSIEVGVKYFAQQYFAADKDINLALQSYNFGGGFIKYAKDRGGYSKQVAVDFSNMMAEKMGWSNYGDSSYVEHVLRYVSNGSTGGQKFDFDKVLAIMRQYEGWQYVWGGRLPSHGGFDCSGLLEYAFKQVGIDISGTAATQYNKTVPVNERDIKPGDLVFFDTDRELTTAEKNDPSLLNGKSYRVSHVGIYIGNNKFYDANNGGIGESSLSTWKNLYRFLGYRRIQ